ncbi:MAG: beta-propeller fold lactonase family protein, partial [bacterium]|nr:beta-propeller fold lactonase family protein [Candidatus Methylomirabilis sp.]
RAYVTNSGSNTVSVIDTAGNAVVGSPIPVGSSPAGIAVIPNGARVYVSNFVDNTVSVIDTATNTVITTIPVGSRPDFLAVSPDGASVYVPNQGSNTVSVIATATNSVTGSPIAVGTAPTGIAFNHVGAPIIPTLSDGALLLLFVAMAATLAVRIAGRSIVDQ